MIRTITVENYKCFEKYQVTLKQRNILIGENNAGKSTLTEIIRIIAIANKYLLTRPYKSALPRYEIGIANVGVYISLKSIEIETDNLFYRYSNPPAKITAQFNDGIVVTIFLYSNDEIFAIAEKEGKLIKSKQKYRECMKDTISVLPQITLLRKEENLITDKTILLNTDTRLTSLHFRNELYYFKENEPQIYNRFRELVQSTWRDLDISSMELYKSVINLEVRNEDFVVEIGKLGSGVQMWLQMLWFIIKSWDSSVIVFDEPDVYLHPDLQKKIVRIISRFQKQLIISTHSVEIMSEVDSDEIVIIDKHDKQSNFATDISEIQDVLDKLGSVHVLNYIRLKKYRRIVNVEGDDKGYLIIFYNKLFPQDEFSFSNIPILKTGGWGSWKAEKEIIKKIKESDYHFKTYYIYDRDYHELEEIEKREEEAKSLKINLHIWSKKEIENYLIHPACISRIIESKVGLKVDEEQINMNIEEAVESMKEEVIYGFSDGITDSSLASSTKIKMGKQKVEENWTSLEHKVKLVSGKELVKRINKICQREYGVQITAKSLANYMEKEEIDEEVKQVILSIKQLKDF